MFPDIRVGKIPLIAAARVCDTIRVNSHDTDIEVVYDICDGLRFWLIAPHGKSATKSLNGLMSGSRNYCDTERAVVNLDGFSTTPDVIPCYIYSLNVPRPSTIG